MGGLLLGRSDTAYLSVLFDGGAMVLAGVWVEGSEPSRVLGKQLEGLQWAGRSPVVELGWAG